MRRVYADFNARNEDGSVALHTSGSTESIAALDSPLVDGETVVLSDGEVEFHGTVYQVFSAVLQRKVWAGRIVNWIA